MIWYGLKNDLLSLRDGTNYEKELTTSMKARWQPAFNNYRLKAFRQLFTRLSGFSLVRIVIGHIVAELTDVA